MNRLAHSGALRAARWLGIGASAALLLTSEFRTCTTESGDRPIAPTARADSSAAAVASPGTREAVSAHSAIVESTTAENADDGALREKLESGEFRMAELDDHQRLAVWRRIGKRPTAR